MLRPTFLVQYNSTGSSSRGKLSGGILLQLEDLFDKEYMKKVLRGSYTLMYAYNRGYFEGIIHMRRDEFEEVFKGNIEKVQYLMTEVPVFRKEICSAYDGVDRPKHKLITKLIPGHLYLDKNNTTIWYYVGNVNIAGCIDKDIVLDACGNLFIHVNKSTNLNKEYIQGDIVRTIESRSRRKLDILKGYKQVIKDLGDAGIDFSDISEYKTILPKTYLYGYERRLIYKMQQM